MDTIKKLTGICCMLLAPAMVIFMMMQAWNRVGLAAAGIVKTNTALQWGIILLVFIPVCAGLFLFGYYAMKGEYKRIPKSSIELED